MRDRKAKLKANWKALKARVRRIPHLLGGYRSTEFGKHMACTMWLDRECTYVACKCGKVFYVVDEPELRNYMTEGAKQMLGQQPERPAMPVPQGWLKLGTAMVVSASIGWGAFYLFWWLIFG